MIKTNIIRREMQAQSISAKDMAEKILYCSYNTFLNKMNKKEFTVTEAKLIAETLGLDILDTFFS